MNRGMLDNVCASYAFLNWFSCASDGLSEQRKRRVDGHLSGGAGALAGRSSVARGGFSAIARSQSPGARLSVSRSTSLKPPQGSLGA